MKTFRALFAAAAVAVLTVGALPSDDLGKGRGHNDGNRGGTQPSGGTSRGGESRGSGNSGGSNTGDRDRGTVDRSRGRSNGDSRPAVGPAYGGGSRGDDVNRGRPTNSGQGNGGPGSRGGQTGGGQSNGTGSRGQGGGQSNGTGSRGQSGGGGQSNGGPGTRGGGSVGGGSNGGGVQSGGGGLGRGSGGYSGGGSSGGGYSGGSGTWGSRGDGVNVISGPDQAGFRDSLLGRKSSRSGSAHYDGSNNVATISRTGGAIIIGRAPVNLSQINKRDHILRRDNVQLNVGGFRVGYYFYDPRWCDDYFWYPWYRFDPWSDRCAISPWYYYPMLPGYVSWDRCRFYSLDPWSIWVGNPYQWQRSAYYGNYDYYGRGRNDIDYAVDDIENAFERGDRRAASRLMPYRSEVAIYVDGRYSYSLNSDDFYDMFMDATQNTKTLRYQILNVESSRDSRDCWRVTARHEYEDPWGRRASVMHYYELRYEGRDLVISKFGVSGEGF